MKIAKLFAIRIMTWEAVDAKPNWELLDKLFELHQPMFGDAYPTDKTLYCSRCKEKTFGPAEHWPCKTLKAAGFEITRSGRAELIKRLAGV